MQFTLTQQRPLDYIRLTPKWVCSYISSFISFYSIRWTSVSPVDCIAMSLQGCVECATHFSHLFDPETSLEWDERNFYWRSVWSRHDNVQELEGEGEQWPAFSEIACDLVGLLCRGYFLCGDVAQQGRKSTALTHWSCQLHWLLLMVNRDSFI